MRFAKIHNRTSCNNEQIYCTDLDSIIADYSIVVSGIEIQRTQRIRQTFTNIGRTNLKQRLTSRFVAFKLKLRAGMKVY